MSITTVMTATGLAVTVFAGALATAQSVVAGDLPGTFARFVLSILLGTVLYLGLVGWYPRSSER